VVTTVDVAVVVGTVVVVASVVVGVVVGTVVVVASGVVGVVRIVVVVAADVVVSWTVVDRQETVSEGRQIKADGSKREVPGHVCG
jgi:hypothetical protein